MQTQNSISGVKKKVAATVAVVLALAIIAGGTYMWTDFSQHKTNEARSALSKYEAVLIEDFEEEDDWKTSDGELKKEISVKNTGPVNSDYKEVYVRIQLKEYMEIAEIEIEKTSARYMIDTNGAYIVNTTSGEPGKTALENAYPGHTVDWLTDAVSGVTAWFVQTKEDDLNGQYGKHVVTKYDVSDSPFKVTPGINRADDDAKKSEKHDVVANGEEPNRNGECDYRKYLWDGSYLTAAKNPTMEYIQWNLNSDDVITLSEWIVAGEPSVAKWIIDNTDGNADPWIYWGEALYPQQVTTDFMKSIELIKQPDGQFYYALHVEMEALSLDELFGENPKWTTMPETIKESYNENAPKVILAGTLSEIEAGTTQQTAPTATVKPDSASQNVTWESSNTNIATVDQDGKVTGVTVGTARITATASNGTTASYTITVVASGSGNNPGGTATGISIDNAGPINMTVGEDVQLTVTLTPSDSTDTVTWSSSNDGVASVDQNGKVHAEAAGGPVTITATANGISDTITVNVSAGVNPGPEPVTGINIDNGDFSMAVGDAGVTLGVTFVPEGASGTVTWESNKTDVATVDSDGTVRAVGEGTAIITATVNGIDDSITVTVTAPALLLKANGGQPYEPKVVGTTDDNLALWMIGEVNVPEDYENTNQVWINQPGSIKLKDILSDTLLITVPGDFAVACEVDSYINNNVTIGYDKNGDLAIIYTNMPPLQAWYDGFPNIPVVETTLTLSREGYASVTINVRMRYDGSGLMW
jgi:uncharacterized protein YjdB